MNSETLNTNIERIEITSLDPNKAYIFKLKINSKKYDDHTIHQLCDQYRKLFKKMGITNILINPTTSDFDFEIIESRVSEFNK